ncbi:hypothetical protein KXD40_001720 [Peronospora effusa]|uniref:RNA helicase n=1 Tax=Peronospora effusa TaxID=542832 RepID=A0A3M6VU53_9STRA|nr:hypothetical protein DD238_000049 [Peronospora effusa]UIZ27200.1 hypothetical protein KXD40_001720 [Peronospora effusa]CAI5705009.1 unnamed protein product [Peronospora effusa]
MNRDDEGRAYVPRRKRRHEQPPPPSTESHDTKSLTDSLYEVSATQETSWARQERGIVVDGEGSIPPPILSFSEFPLSSDAILVLQSRGVTKPSAVQAQALPCISQGRDVVVLAPTGSGKTLCYILPMLELLQRLPYRSTELEQYAAIPQIPTAPCALVVVPTRELADQVVQDFSEFFRDRTIPPVVGIYGGIAVAEQLLRLGKHAYDAMVVVATPGRLLHLLLHHRASLSLEQISLLVVDEVDRVLESPEMETQLREILQLANPAGRQTLLLSATLPVFLPRMARSAVLRPVTIRVDEASMLSHNASVLSSGTRNTSAVKLALSTTSNVVHDVQFMRPAEKPSRLLRVLRTTKQPPVLVFCNSRASVERVARLLRNEQFHAAPLHGGQSQGYRTQALRAFRAGYVDVLVATDLASRGLDFPGVINVVLFDIPSTIEDYIHRCGRTGRHPGGDTGGSNVTGKATSFLTRECTIAMELKQVLRAALQSVPRELDIPRNFGASDTQASSSNNH